MESTSIYFADAFSIFHISLSRNKIHNLDVPLAQFSKCLKSRNAPKFLVLSFLGPFKELNEPG